MRRNQLVLSVTEEQRNELDKWAGRGPYLRVTCFAQAAALLPPPVGADSAHLLCLLCTGSMDHHAYGGGDIGTVMIDSCEACCQVWLQRGTLRKILTNPDPEPVDPTPDALERI
jgi:Zn-finger nucleic acid-binding protein